MLEISAVFNWLASEQGLQAMLMEKWLYGLLVIAVVIYLEAVAFFLPFIPGDSMLVTAGVFIGAAGISPVLAIVFISISAIMADATNYTVGRSRLGDYILKKRWLKDKHVAKVRRYFYRYGSVTIIGAHYLPVLRTATPFLAGMMRFNIKKCGFYGAVGSLIWVSSLLLVGFYAGQLDWVRRYIIIWPVIMMLIGLAGFLFYLLIKSRES